MSLIEKKLHRNPSKQFSDSDELKYIIYSGGGGSKFTPSVIEILTLSLAPLIEEIVLTIKTGVVAQIATETAVRLFLKRDQQEN
jgi:hypothetical protein